MRLIDADAIKYTARFTDYADGRMTSDAVITKCEIDSMPTVDPVKHGRWMAHDSSARGVPIEACSICYVWSYGHNENYCPNCGAYMMDGENDEAD